MTGVQTCALPISIDVPFDLDYIEDRLIDLIRIMEPGRVWQPGVNFADQYFKFSTFIKLALAMFVAGLASSADAASGNFRSK